MKLLQRNYPHLLAFLGFVLVALVYFYPVLQNKTLYQSDIAQYTGMAKEQNDFRARTGEEPYWTNSAFGGMPTYQVGANYPHNYIKKLDAVIRFLPRPADYLFLYFAGFYVLALVLRADPLKAFFGALAFGLSTYLIVILGVGHNAKAHAIGYMPLMIAGIILVFRKRYLVGGLLTLFATALELNANHFQMTYYLLFLLLILAIYYTVGFIKRKEYRELGKVAGTFAVAALLAVGANAANLMATSEYANFSMRGKSELTFKPDGTPNTSDSAMDYGYITEYSYGVAESLDLVAPRLFGGGHGEKLGTDSAVFDLLKAQGATDEEASGFADAYAVTYWGDQPIVEAPAYIGVVVFFLAILGLFTDRRRLKWVFWGGALLSLLLSWGKNFDALTRFFVDVVPLYDKFRAVSSIQVLLELCFPVLALMGFTSFFRMDTDKRFAALWKATAVAGGLFVILYVSSGLFEFRSAIDGSIRDALTSKENPTFGDDFIEALREDRLSMFKSDTLRSLLLVLAAAGALLLYVKNIVKQQWAVVLVGILMLADLFAIDRNYVDTKDKGEDGRRGFVSVSEMKRPFTPSPADEEILADPDIFRVYDVQGNLQGETSFFHKATGGYSAVRPRRYEQLFQYQVDPALQDLGAIIDPNTMSLKKSIPTLNVLNVRYLLLGLRDGSEAKITNPFANGNAWFVQRVIPVKSADGEIKAMKAFDNRKEAIVNTSEFKVPAIAVDSTASIQLDKASFQPNYAKYTAKSAKGGLAVFSEVYYPKGWKVFIDGKQTDQLIRANYVLRALPVPAGNHTIEFRFDPDVVKTGGLIQLVSCLGIVLVTGGGLYLTRKKHSKS
ncbi:MAG TPA: YfhO family protein [Flavobacterium sp.]|nr:YfhO family protein [Flavobacterium sp.]